MGPVWRLIKGQKDMCHRCGKEIVDFPAVGQRRRLPVPARGEVLLGLLPVPDPVRGRGGLRVPEPLPAGDQARDPVTRPGRLPARLASSAARTSSRSRRRSWPASASPSRTGVALFRDARLSGAGPPRQPRPRSAPRQPGLLQRQPLPEPHEPLLGGLRALRLGQEGQRARRLRDGDRRVRRGGRQGLQRGGHRVPHRRRPPSDLALSGYYTGLMRALKERFPGVHLKAWTMVELDWIAQVGKQDARRDDRGAPRGRHGLLPGRRRRDLREARPRRHLHEQDLGRALARGRARAATARASARTRRCSTAASRPIEDRVDHLRAPARAAGRDRRASRV